MTKEEYKQFQKKLTESGQTQQSFLLNAIDGATIASREEVEQLKSINQNFAELVRQVKGLATNVNQMAYVANATGRTPIEKRLADIGMQVADFRKEVEIEWQLIRQSISRQRHMEP
jgi:hypothetical protein